MRNYLFILGILLLQFYNCNAQEKKSVALIAKSNQREILLRWAPTTPVYWNLGNKYGYRLYRTTMLRNGKLLSREQMETVEISQKPLKPLPLSDWEQLIEKNDYCAIAAQAIYGDSFSISDNSGFLGNLKQVEENESRFSFALFAADQSLQVAQYAGLFFKDENAVPGEKYLYHVFINLPYINTEVSIDTSTVYLSLDDYQPLPAIDQLYADFGDQVVNLKWNLKSYEEIYSSYYIERSENGEQFHSITTNSILPTKNQSVENQILAQYVDSLDTNLKKYYYRIRGVSYFGEEGPYSEIISGNGIPSFLFNANIINADTTSLEVKLLWEFPAEGMDQLLSYNIHRADNEAGPYTMIASELGKHFTSIIDNSAGPSNYYIVESLDRFGSRTNSLPYFVQLDDNILPSQPTGLVGHIDTTGVVYLQWESNKEIDLKGYKVYKKNFSSDDYSLIDSKVIENIGYVDTIKINNLTETIYYGIRAVDQRYNLSEFAEIKLNKPDLIPPSSPVMLSAKGKEGYVEIRWINSSSHDVIGHLVYRSEDGNQWNLIASIELSQGDFYIDEVQDNSTYHYLIVAMDDSGLESVPSQVISVSTDQISPKITLNGSHNVPMNQIRLHWNDLTKPVKTIYIYKSLDGNELSMFKSLEGFHSEYFDDDLIIGSIHNYQLRVEFKDGSYSKFSNKVSIQN